MHQRRNEQGAAGWGLLWLLGVPIPILLVLFVLEGLHLIDNVVWR